MSKTQIGTGTEAEFFARGKRLARQADRGERLVETHIVTFQDPAEVAQLPDVGRRLASSHARAAAHHLAGHSRCSRRTSGALGAGKGRKL
ncbi:hypothetical protein B0G57_102128 [Trinickia symbiotica]|uniref:Uncharacterized protein n=1 Tax=Trinickia symbiotica TaxID=863227 RepID=A0A2N7X9V5_9BURK|nr:hypothetical protein C0Z20_01330 [Trinickia symbiotica]PPK46533.1 hypothetical protein B0G57_102128 [Trinickia symbiotica]